MYEKEDSSSEDEMKKVSPDARFILKFEPPPLSCSDGMALTVP
jgi:hypothetical protein